MPPKLERSKLHKNHSHSSGQTVKRLHTSKKINSKMHKKYCQHQNPLNANKMSAYTESVIVIKIHWKSENPITYEHRKIKHKVQLRGHVSSLFCRAQILPGDSGQGFAFA